MNVSPCVHPRCSNADGDPRLTTTGMCEPCRRRYRRELDWLSADYWQIAATMPTPATISGEYFASFDLSA